jgi:hypothetical protein
MIWFIIIMLLWISCGMQMIYHGQYKNSVNWWGFIFMGIIPFIPIIAKLFGID